ncbi:sulfatase-like hydrolase/transferase [Tunicatimonas pelagia]|uniref:sulfatase-like hydrolase/transferase n=1 Tax=Tunicatimonas pelagia TaxID=931531 RepID=UPI0026653535|nr:sulfatase-like hydrolase/transferase [Tunicatimonas pelagia]WKN44031.1 sulfatase-like hydrolase/transferase [Tunicatimonas pelagia]
MLLLTCRITWLYLLLVPSFAFAQTGDPPNIIYILADDMGYGDLKSLNAASQIPTPHMDQLVQEGVHFTDAHTNSAVCTPTRYGILTGRYAFRTHLKQGVLWGYSPALIEPERATVATFLQDQGYHTACIGKWHLGLDWVKQDPQQEIKDVKWNDRVPQGYQDNVDYSQPVSNGPANHGFDYSLIIPASLDMSPYCYLRNNVVVQPPTAYTEGKSQEADGRGVFWREGKVSPSFDFDRVLPTLVDSACAYVKRRASQADPFFLYLPLPAPHTPWLPTEAHHDRSEAGRYGDFVTMVDAMVGQVMQTVAENGLTENTLIIVTSDNGADWNPEDQKQYAHRANHIYKGRKADIYEAGHRVPFVARWPGVIPAGQRSNQIMCSTDLMATLAGMLNASVAETAGEDSENLWPAFIGTDRAPIREEIVHHSLRGVFSIRQGKWKYTPHRGSGGFTEPVTIAPNPGEPSGTLYDLEADPREEHNLYEKYPDKVAELAEQLKKYQENNTP